MESILLNDNRNKLFKKRKKSVEGLYKQELSSIEKEDYAIEMSLQNETKKQAHQSKFKRWASHARNDKDQYNLTDPSMEQSSLPAADVNATSQTQLNTLSGTEQPSTQIADGHQQNDTNITFLPDEIQE